MEHNMSRTQLYKCWTGIKQRCYNKNCTAYHKYGAKGITMCNEWKNDFKSFAKWALSNGYICKKKVRFNELSIDRIDNCKGYSPENCRWVNTLIQNTHLSMLSTNTSGYTGVSWSKKEKKWICVISINNKSKRIGSYNTQKEAVNGRNKFIEENNLPHKKNIYIGELVKFD